MSESNSELEEMRIDRQLRQRRDISRTDGGGSSKRILEALVVAAILALTAAVWNLTQTATLLGERQDSQRRDFERLEKRQDSLEGKLTRGELPNALDQQ